MVSMPLVPTFSGATLEPGALGIIGMSLNGVPTYGAQESGGTNAVEGTGAIIVPYYGHAAPSGDWHYHSGEFGKVTNVASYTSTTLLGYAMDGFPIYGPLADASVLDECNGFGATASEYKYHVRTLPQVDEALGYCDGTSPAINWAYVLGCYKGTMTKSAVADSTTTSIPSDCVLSGSVPVTPSPVSPVTAPPTKKYPNGFCFSGETTVAVKHKGSILMKDLQIGDEVLTTSGNYEEVYSFGHRLETIEAEFLHLLPSGLEISSDHMVMVNGRFVPASLVQVGDILESSDGTFVTVSSIEMVIRNGVYAPFTASGTIVVSNIKASTYVAFQDTYRVHIGSWESPLTFQWVAQVSQSPHRLITSLGWAGVEEYTEDGKSSWVAGPHDYAKWLMEQSGVVQGAVLLPALGLGLMSMAAEGLVSLFV
jgi:hypothetical protein